VKGQTVVRAAYGMADLERDVPITPVTVFEAGSVAKQVTAAAVLLLERDGRLSLEDPVHKYIPELPDYGAPITIRQMLQHTAGLRDWEMLITLAGLRYGTFRRGDTEMLDLVRRQRTLNFPPGTRWEYTNTGYTLAAMIVSRVSRTPFAEFTERRIFQPLGMADTSWQLDLGRVVKGKALAYGERDGMLVVDLPILLADGAGGLQTTVDDLLRWNNNFVSPKVGDTAFLRALQHRTTFADGRTHEYALGQVVDTYRGVPEADHSGAFAAYRSYVSRYPDQQVSIAVLCNSAAANPTTYGKALAQLLLGDALQSPAAPAAMSSTAINDEDSRRFAGLYRRSPQPGFIRIAREGTALVFNGVSPLLPMSRTVLRQVDTGDTMDCDDKGSVRYVDEFGTVDMYERVEPVTPSLDDLRSYVGDYYSEEIDTTWRIVVDGTQLVIDRRPRRYPLTPVYANTFSTPTGIVQFDRDAGGRIAGLRFSQERVWNLRFARRASGGG
jgi:CubicO group peptidase (beta-lactamase class C family)